MAVRWPGPPQRSSWIIINWSSPNCYLGSDDGAKKVMNGSSSLKSSTLAPLQPRRAQLRSWWGLWLKLSVTCSTFPRTWQLTPVSAVVCACAGREECYQGISSSNWSTCYLPADCDYWWTTSCHLLKYFWNIQRSIFSGYLISLPPYWWYLWCRRLTALHKWSIILHLLVDWILANVRKINDYIQNINCQSLIWGPVKIFDCKVIR